MMSPTFALDFAQDWIESWKARALERLLAHYADDFEMSSPVIAEFMRERSGTLRGKDVIRDNQPSSRCSRLLSGAGGEPGHSTIEGSVAVYASP